MSRPVTEGDRFSVLVVEDDKNVAFTLREVLKPQYDVTLAGSVDEAHEAFQDNCFDIALVDDRLPEAAGVELLAAIRDCCSTTVRILMSAWVDSERLLKGINEGKIYGFMEKPIEPSRLLATVSQAVQMRKVIQERDEAQEALERQNSSLEYLVDERTRQLEERNKQLEILATRDPLTGLFNRRYIEHKLDEELARLKRYKTPYSIVIMDIDDFKAINDTLGHSAGDHVLVQVASVLKNNIRQVDLVSRIGGEEFLIVLPNTGLAAAELTANRLRRRVGSLSTPLIDEMNTRGVTISGGIAEGEPADPTWKTVLDRADVGLYRAKADGKNCVRSGD